MLLILLPFDTLFNHFYNLPGNFFIGFIFHVKFKIVAAHYCKVIDVMFTISLV